MSAVDAMPREQAGVASAVAGTARQIRGVTGVALLGSLTATRFADLASDRLLTVPRAARVRALSAIHDFHVPSWGDARIVHLHDAFASATHVSYAAAGAAAVLIALVGGHLTTPPRRCATAIGGAATTDPASAPDARRVSPQPRDG